MERRLDIESDMAVELASGLAALTGESLTDAVIGALRDRLERQQEAAPRRQLTEAEGRQMIQEVRAMTAEIRARWHGPTTSDHSWLYGDDGLPK